MIRFYKTIILFIIIQLYFNTSVNAQNCISKPSNLIKILIDCSNDQCSYKKSKDIIFFINIFNKTNMNLEIKVQSLDIKFLAKKISNHPALYVNTLIPNYTNEFRIFNPDQGPAFYQRIQNNIQNIKDEKLLDILATVTVNTYVRYPSSSEPIGNYKNSKFEPTLFSCTKQFHLQIQ